MGENMPDFNEIDWREYKVKLRASDNTRRTLNRLAQGDNLMYFQSTDIYLDVRLFLNRKEKKIEDLKDVIKYKWSLCTEDGKPVQIDQSRLLNFCFPNGSGVADLKTATKFTTFDRFKTGELFWDTFRGKTFFRQVQAIHIGHLSKLDHYIIAMQFTKNEGNTSEYYYMGDFTIFDKDKIRYAIIITLIGVIGTAIAGLILFLFGIHL